MKKEFAIIFALIVSIVILAIQYDRVEKERDALQAQVKSLQKTLTKLCSSKIYSPGEDPKVFEVLVSTEIDTAADMDVLATNEVDTPEELVFFLPEPPWQTNK